MGSARLGLLLLVGFVGGFDAAKGQMLPGLNFTTMAAAPQAGWSFSNLGQTLTGVVRNAISAVGVANPATQQADSAQTAPAGTVTSAIPSPSANAGAPALQAALPGIGSAAAPIYQSVADALENVSTGALPKTPDGNVPDPFTLPGYLGIAAVHAAAPLSQGARDAIAVTNAGILPGMQTANSALRSAVGGVNETYSSAVKPADTLLQGAAASLPFAPALAPSIAPVAGNMARAIGPATTAAQTLASNVYAPSLLSAQNAIRDAADAASTVADNVNLRATSLVPPMPVGTRLPVFAEGGAPAEAPEVDNAIDAAVGASLDISPGPTEAASPGAAPSYLPDTGAVTAAPSGGQVERAELSSSFPGGVLLQNAQQTDTSATPEPASAAPTATVSATAPLENLWQHFRGTAPAGASNSSAPTMNLTSLTTAVLTPNLTAGVGVVVQAATSIVNATMGTVSAPALSQITGGPAAQGSGTPQAAGLGLPLTMGRGSPLNAGLGIPLSAAGAVPLVAGLTSQLQNGLKPPTDASLPGLSSPAAHFQDRVASAQRTMFVPVPAPGPGPVARQEAAELVRTAANILSATPASAPGGARLQRIANDMQTMEKTASQTIQGLAASPLTFETNGVITADLNPFSGAAGPIVAAVLPALLGGAKAPSPMPAPAASGDGAVHDKPQDAGAKELPSENSGSISSAELKQGGGVQPKQDILTQAREDKTKDVELTGDGQTFGIRVNSDGTAHMVRGNPALQQTLKDGVPAGGEIISGVSAASSPRAGLGAHGLPSPTAERPSTSDTADSVDSRSEKNVWDQQPMETQAAKPVGFEAVLAAMSGPAPAPLPGPPSTPALPLPTVVAGPRGADSSFLDGVGAESSTTQAPSMTPSASASTSKADASSTSQAPSTAAAASASVSTSKTDASFTSQAPSTAAAGAASASASTSKTDVSSTTQGPSSAAAAPAPMSQTYATSSGWTLTTAEIPVPGIISDVPSLYPVTSPTAGAISKGVGTSASSLPAAPTPTAQSWDSSPDVAYPASPLPGTLSSVLPVNTAGKLLPESNLPASSAQPVNSADKTLPESNLPASSAQPVNTAEKTLPESTLPESSVQPANTAEKILPGSTLAGSPLGTSEPLPASTLASSSSLGDSEISPETARHFAGAGTSPSPDNGVARVIQTVASNTIDTFQNIAGVLPIPGLGNQSTRKAPSTTTPTAPNMLTQFPAALTQFPSTLTGSAGSQTFPQFPSTMTSFPTTGARMPTFRSIRPGAGAGIARSPEGAPFGVGAPGFELSFLQIEGRSGQAPLQLPIPPQMTQAQPANPITGAARAVGKALTDLQRSAAGLEDSVVAPMTNNPATQAMIDTMAPAAAPAASFAMATGGPAVRGVADTLMSTQAGLKAAADGLMASQGLAFPPVEGVLEPAAAALAPAAVQPSPAVGALGQPAITLPSLSGGSGAAPATLSGLPGLPATQFPLPDGAAEGLAKINTATLSNITDLLAMPANSGSAKTISAVEILETARVVPAPEAATNTLVLLGKLRSRRAAAGSGGSASNAWQSGGVTAPEAAPAGEGAPELSFADMRKNAAAIAAESSQWWAGERILQPAQVQEKQAAGAIPKGPYLSGSDFNDLNDSELFEVFTNGVADTPSALPGEVGNWTFCVGRALTNALTNESWPHGVWPQGDRSPLENFAKRIWRGNTLYTDPATNETVVVNMLLSNSSVAWISTNVEKRPVGLSADKKPSVVISYRNTELLPTRFFTDELRRVGPNIWLARAWFVDIVGALNPSNPLPFTAPLVDIAKGVENATYNLAVEAIGFQGPNSTPTTSGGTYPIPGDPFTAFWFSLECVNDAVPKLFYTPVSYAATAVGSLTGYYPPFYMLPGLNPTAGQFSVENWSLEFPTSVEGTDFPPFILWPWKWSDIGPIGYLKLPALPLEFINGVWFLYNPTAPGDPTFHPLPFGATAPSPAAPSAADLVLPAVNFTAQVIQATQDLTKANALNVWMLPEASAAKSGETAQQSSV